MKLMTKAIETLAQKQFPLGNEWEKQKIVAKFFNPTGSWSWYLINQDPNDPDYLWCIVKGFEVECGSVSLSELQSFKGQFGLGIERDLHFKPMPVKELWDKLNRGEHV
jgi:hypothetical protein